MKTSILPITIKGTRDALRAKGMRSRAGVEVDVDIHPPIDPARYAGMDRKSSRDALMDDVRKAIAS